jgi:hypothetical protein
VKIRGYLIILFIITGILVFENFMLNNLPNDGILGFFKLSFPECKDWNLSPLPGRPVSLWLGWIGVGFILLTNPYIMRKRIGFMSKWGSLANWFNFHIFCGLLGPIFIIFHTNFKVGGLVAVSFWSMVIVAASGIIGRYFHGQIAGRRSELEGDLRAAESALAEMWKKYGAASSEEEFTRIKVEAVKMAGGGEAAAGAAPGMVGALASSMAGDIRMMFGSLKRMGSLPPRAWKVLKIYAVTKRRLFFFARFQSALGYWHAFHLPFAFFMYIVASIHIVTALLFGVKS